jgi:hypothetical protein
MGLLVLVLPPPAQYIPGVRKVSRLTPFISYAATKVDGIELIAVGVPALI